MCAQHVPPCEGRQRRTVAMQFDDLPVELILKIFSHLPQCHLANVALVSDRWKRLAYDPSLWMEVCINSRGDASRQRVREILDRATMIRKLDISAGMVNLYTIAKASSSFNRLDELWLPTSALSHSAVPDILRNCSSLSTLSLRGSYFLVDNDVRNLENVPSLRHLIATEGFQIYDEILQQVTVSCPNINTLKFHSGQIASTDTWQCLERLGDLRLLSVSEMSTVALLHASKNCPNLEFLEIDTIRNKNGVSVAESLEGFTKLKSLSVHRECGDGWFKAEFLVPPLLEHLDVSELELQEAHLMQLISACKNTLQHVTTQLLVGSALKYLSSCRNLQEISVYGVSENAPLLQLISQLPKLTRLQVKTVGNAKETTRQLLSIVDIRDRSERGHTKLVINMFCSSKASQYAMLLEVHIFKEYLALNTGLSQDHIEALEQQLWRLKYEALLRPPCGSEILQIIVTSFPVIGKALKHLTLNIINH